MNVKDVLQEMSVGLVSSAQTKLACVSQCTRDCEVDCESACARHPKRCRGEIGRNESGQGTTEYAILVGVLVVIAILAITVFRGKIQELWNSISDGINSL